MSAFVVDTQTMTRAVKALVCKWEETRLIKRFGEFVTEDSTAGRDIGRALFTMNVEAVMQRYPDCRDNPADMPGCSDSAEMPTTFDFGSFRPIRSLPEMVDCYKALDCLRYQCSEGDVPKMPLFIALDEACKEIAENIVTALPSYQRAAW